MPVSQEEITEDGEPSVDFASSIEKVKDVSQTVSLGIMFVYMLCIDKVFSYPSMVGIGVPFLVKLLRRYCQMNQMDLSLWEIQVMITTFFLLPLNWIVVYDMSALNKIKVLYL